MGKKFKPAAIMDKLANMDPVVAKQGVSDLEAAMAEEEIDDRALKDALKDKRRPVRAAVAKVLHEADDENLDAILVLARDGDDTERKEAFWDLETKGRNQRVLAALVDGAKDANEEVREAAAQGLKEVSTFELDPAKPDELIGKSKFGGAPDGLATDDIPEGARFVGQLAREDVGLKKFAMAYFFVKGTDGLCLLGGGGPRSKPKKDEQVFAISLGEGRNILTPLDPSAPAPAPKCDGCSKDMRFLAELPALEDLHVLPEGKAGAFVIYACTDECRTVSAKAVFKGH
jgi:hypothetical protein